MVTMSPMIGAVFKELDRGGKIGEERQLKSLLGQGAMSGIDLSKDVKD